MLTWQRDGRGVADAVTVRREVGAAYLSLQLTPQPIG